MTLYTGDPDYYWHNSALSTLRSCEQKFQYRYIDGLSRPPSETSVPLLRGSWFHALMQAQGLKQGNVQGTLLDPVGDTIDLGFDGHEEVSLHHFGDPDHPAFVRQVHAYITENIHDYMRGMDEEVDGVPDEVWQMYLRYLDAHADSLLSEEVLGVEVEWQREHHGMRYQGKADRIVRRSDGLIVVRDHKTTGRKPTSDFRLVNSQLHLYAWGVAEWLHERTDEEPDAVEYDYVITRKVPDVKLTKAGNLYKTSLGADPWSMRTGLFDIGEDPENPKWANVLEQAKENVPDFFSRNLMPVNVRAVARLLEENEMLAARALNVVALGQTPIRNTGQQCDWCEFAAICSGDLYGNDTTILKEEMQ